MIKIFTLITLCICVFFLSSCKKDELITITSPTISKENTAKNLKSSNFISQSVNSLERGIDPKEKMDPWPDPWKERMEPDPEPWKEKMDPWPDPWKTGTINPQPKPEKGG